MRRLLLLVGLGAALVLVRRHGVRVLTATTGTWIGSPVPPRSP